MKCETLSHIDTDGKKVMKPKRQFNTLDEAIKEAKKRNAEFNTITKLVAYKCDKCFKYHIGRNGKTITDKEKIKFQKSTFNFKVLGKITI